MQERNPPLEKIKVKAQKFFLSKFLIRDTGKPSEFER
jgi:hypothetical protein